MQILKEMLSDIKNNFQPDKLKLLKAFQIKSSFDLIHGNIPGDMNGYHITADFDLAFNLEKQLVKAELDLDFKTFKENSSEEKNSAEFCYVFIFKVENLTELATLGEEGKIGVDKNLGNALASVTYSTCRGMLLVQLKGTPFENFMLPIIDPDQLLKREVTEYFVSK